MKVFTKIKSSEFSAYTVSSAMWCIFSLFPGVHPLLFLLTSIPVAIGGGCVTFFMAVYCYVSDTTEPSGRALRFVHAHSVIMSSKPTYDHEQNEEEVIKNDLRMTFY